MGIIIGTHNGNAWDIAIDSDIGSVSKKILVFLLVSNPRPQEIKTKYFPAELKHKKWNEIVCNK